jgi:hypothetical protein
VTYPNSQPHKSTPNSNICRVQNTRTDMDFRYTSSVFGIHEVDGVVDLRVGGATNEEGSAYESVKCQYPRNYVGIINETFTCWPWLR